MGAKLPEGVYSPLWLGLGLDPILPRLGHRAQVTVSRAESKPVGQLRAQLEAFLGQRLRFIVPAQYHRNRAEVIQGEGSQALISNRAAPGQAGAQSFVCFGVLTQYVCDDALQAQRPRGGCSVEPRGTGTTA